MGLIINIFSWGWILGVALIAPVVIPVCIAYPLEIRSQDEGDGTRLFTLKDEYLYSSPYSISRINIKSSVGTPIRLIFSWMDIEGEKWLFVEDIQNNVKGWIKA